MQKIARSKLTPLEFPFSWLSTSRREIGLDRGKNLLTTTIKGENYGL